MTTMPGSRQSNYRRSRGLARKMGAKDKARIRRAVIRRQGRRCFYCSKFVAIPQGHTDIQKGEKLWGTLDHLKPLSLGGRNTINNIVLACYKCHQKRHEP